MRTCCFLSSTCPCRALYRNRGSMYRPTSPGRCLSNSSSCPTREPDERPPEATTLRSNRVSRAKDLHDAPLPESHLPYTDGLVQSPAQPRSEVGQQGERGERRMAHARTEVDQNRREDAENEVVSTDFASSLKLRKTWPPQQPKSALYGRPGAPGVLPLKNLQSHALEQGGLQLSTYNWEFAPYLAYLKRHIGDHIHPPAAFTQLGLIQGQTRLKFRIMPDGSLADLKVIDFDGSPYLRDTSTRAVELSADFRPLPAHFPEDYLENFRPVPLSDTGIAITREPLHGMGAVCAGGADDVSPFLYVQSLRWPLRSSGRSVCDATGSFEGRSSA